MHRHRLPYLHIQHRGGRTYYAFRRGKLRVALPGDPHESAEASRIYWDARQGRINVRPRFSVSAVIESYRLSPEWRALAAGSRATYETALTSIDAQAGDADIRTFRRHHMIRVRNKLAEKPGAANLRLAVWAVLFEHAINMGLLTVNPAKGVRKLRGGEGHRPWPAWALKLAREWPRQPPWWRTYLELGIGTGQRPGDVRAMRWADIDGDGIGIVQQKTGAELWVPFTRTLAAHLDTLPRGLATIVSWPDGAPVSKSQAHWQMTKIREDHPELALYSAHGWRYNAASELADAGCTDAEIAAITGHKGRAMVVKYSAKSGQRTRARKAQERRG